MKVSQYWSSSIAVFFSQFFIYLQGILLIPIIINLAGDETYGAYSLINTLLCFVFGISAFGVGFKARRMLPASASASERQSLFFPQFIWNLLSVLFLALLLALFSPYFVEHYFNDVSAIRLNWLVISFFLLSSLIYSQSMDYFRHTARVALYSFGTVSLPYLFLALIYCFYLYKGQLQPLDFINIYSFSSLLIGAIFFAGIYREIGFKVSLPSYQALAQDMSFGLPLMLSYLTETVLASSDRFILASVLGAKELASYVPAYTLGMIILIIPKIVTVALPVFLSKAVDQNNRQLASALIERVIYIFIAIVAPFVLGAIIFARDVLALYVNNDVAARSWVVVPIVALAGLFYGLTYILLSVLNVLMKTKSSFKVIALAAIVNVFLNLIFLPLFKSQLVPAITTLVAYCISFTYILKEVKASWSLTMDLFKITKIVISASLMAFSAYIIKLYLIQPYSVITLLISIFIAILAYLLSAAFLGLLRDLRSSFLNRNSA